jgi:eukaryotic-like serine/threonine-protein kinase
MTSEQWQQIKGIVQTALEIEPADRSRFLAENCSGDKFLYREVQSLLDSYENAGDFIQTPAFVGRIKVLATNNFSAELETGKHIGHYEVLSELARGGMGAVYLAEDTQLKRKVAIKILPVDFAAQTERVRRFKREALAVSSLNHPNIITIYEIGHIDSIPFIVTEFIDGVTLRERLAEASIDLSEALDVFVQVAAALAAAHSAGIVHRDIKPENVMIRTDGLVKVLDFGIAKLAAQTAEGGSEISTPNATEQYLLGTPKYISPEQIRGLTVDARTDIWSLGVVFYEMVTGLTPYEGKTNGEIISSILEHKPPPPIRQKLKASTEIDRIVSKCLEDDRNARYQSAQELLADLKNLKHRIESGATSSAKAQLKPFTSPYAIAAIIFVVAALIATLAYAISFRGLPIAAPPEVKALAVLPLENLGGDPAQDYFADGLTEALINDLAQIGAVRVISRTSVMRYKTQQKPLPQIAQELNVDAVVEGTILRSGDRVRIAAKLTYIPTGIQLWSDSYEGELRDVLALQQKVTRDVAAEIRIKLTPQEQARLTSTRSVKPEALEAYLKGRHYLNKRNEQSIRTAIAYFDEAIAKDSNFALPHAFLADAYFALGTVIISAMPPPQALAKGEAAALRSLELDQTLAEGHTALGVIKLYSWQWSAAEEEFKRALELNPNYAPAHSWYAIYFGARGRVGESIARMYRAREIDPLSPHISQNLGWMLHFARQYDEAIEQYRRTLELDPNFQFARLRLAGAYLAKGMLGEAIAEYESATAPSDRNSSASLGHAYGLSGRKNEARQILRELLKMREQRYVNPFSIAMVYVGLGEREHAFEWLEKAYQERSYFMVFLKVSNDFDPYRDDPRYVDLMRRIGLA